MSDFEFSDFGFINELKGIEQDAYDAGKRVREQISNPIYDVRVSTFVYIAQAVRWFKIYLIFKNEYLEKPDWYNDIYISENGYGQQRPEILQEMLMTINDHRMLIRANNEVMILAYSQVLHSIVESKFRRFLMKAYPDALKNRNLRDWSFRVVYTVLLEESNKTQYTNLIKFFSLVRNTIHNNGRYWKENEQYVSISYRDNPFEFKHGDMVKYRLKYGERGAAFTLLLKQITPDIIDMMEDIIMDTKLKDIPSIPEY